MKKTNLFGIVIMFVFMIGFVGVQGSTAATHKIIKKTIRKVITPQIEPASPPTTNETNKIILTAPTAPKNTHTALSTKTGLWGWGINTNIAGSYQINSGGGIFTGKWEMLFADPLKIGEKIGLAEDAVEYKTGLGAALGNDNNGVSLKSIPLYVGSTLYLKEGSFFGADPFIGLDLGYNLYGSGQTGGGVNYQILGGILTDFGFSSGKTALGLGYNVYRVADTRKGSGVFINVTQPFIL